MTRGQRLVVILVGGLLTGLAGAFVARRVGAPKEALVPAGLVGLVLGAFFAARVLTAFDTARGAVEDVRALRAALRDDDPTPPVVSAPPVMSATAEGLTEWLAGREDLRLFAQDEVAALPGALGAGERVTAVGLGVREGAAGLLAVTDRRVLFLRKGGGTDEVSLPDVSSVTVEEGTVTSAVKLGHRAGEVAFEVPAQAAATIAGALGKGVRVVEQAPPVEAVPQGPGSPDARTSGGSVPGSEEGSGPEP